MSITLSYPTVTPTITLTLRGPELGNTSQFNTQRVNEESRGGSLIIFRKPDWPKTKQFQMSFTGLTEAEGQQLITLIETSLGKPVKLIDWTGRQFTGIITSTQSPIVRNRDTCNLSGELSFELVDGT